MYILFIIRMLRRIATKIPATYIGLKSWTDNLESLHRSYVAIVIAVVVNSVGIITLFTSPPPTGANP